MEEFDQNQGSKRTLKSYLPVYIAVFVLIVVLIIIYTTLMGNDTGSSSTSTNMDTVSPLEQNCLSYANQYPITDNLGIRSVLFLGDSDPYCEIVLVGVLGLVNENNFELKLPTKVQPDKVLYSQGLEVIPFNSINTFAPEIYDLPTFEKLKQFENLIVGVTINVNQNDDFIAKQISVGGYEMSLGDIQEIETEQSTQSISEDENTNEQ